MINTPKTEDTLTEEELQNAERYNAAGRFALKDVSYPPPYDRRNELLGKLIAAARKGIEAQMLEDDTPGALGEYMRVFSPPQAPGHTDLMVPPETIDGWLKNNPLPEPGGVEGLVVRLRLSIATASNDDTSLPRTEKRARHVARIDAIEDAITTLQKISKERDALREALKFYADKSRYDNDTQIARGDGTYDISCSVLDDEGAIARAALTQDGGA